LHHIDDLALSCATTSELLHETQLCSAAITFLEKWYYWMKPRPMEIVGAATRIDDELEWTNLDPKYHNSLPISTISFH
jgi:ADP-ribosylglycohydrolase